MFTGRADTAAQVSRHKPPLIGGSGSPPLPLTLLGASSNVPKFGLYFPQGSSGLKVAFVASEGVPFSKTGGLADVVGALPKAVAALGHEVEVILPRYRVTPQGSSVPHAQSLTLALGSGFRFAAVQDAGRAHQVQTYLIDCPEYFDREGLYQTKGEDYPDNAHRFAAFSLAALEFLKHGATSPDIIHCHDWQTALVPIYLRNLYRDDGYFAKTAVLFTLHNLG